MSAYLHPVASLTLPRLSVEAVPVNHVNISAISPAKYAIEAGINILYGGTWPKAAQTARQKSRNVTGWPFETETASPAAVRVVRRFSMARTCASATLPT